ncbi:MAG: S9 family peptidase [Deltaproteobacteria bacterium]|nr:S9 family peptidase [Deltaproteobacteria bacterium]
MAAQTEPNSQAGELIPREVILGNPVRISVRISPDGTRLCYVAPSAQGVLNAWVKTIGRNDDSMITNDTHRGITHCGWAYNGRQLLYIQDKDGDENWHLYTVDPATKKSRDLTPFPGVRAQDFMTDKRHPDQLYIGLNKRDPKVFDMYRLNLKSGDLSLAAVNPGDVQGWVADHNLIIRGAVASNPTDGSTVIRIRTSAGSPWNDVITAPYGVELDLIGFTPDNQKLRVSTSLDSDTSRLVELDGRTGNPLRTIIANDQADLGEVMIDDDTHEVQAVSFTYLRRKWTVVDQSLKADFETLSKVKDGEMSIISRDLAKRKWIVTYNLDNAPYSYYLYDSQTKQAEFLFTHKPALEKFTLAKMNPVIIESRDGLKLVSFLTLPPGGQTKPERLVLLVHGGPWARDYWGYDGQSQWLANRGYAVLQVNFRGSDGFGEKFLNAGNGQWGTGGMQHDWSDAVHWAIKSGVADPKQIAIMGGSYGGYAVLAGLTFTPQLYACGVDLVGPSNVKTLMESIPPYWEPMKKQMLLRIGDAEKDQALNQRISPLFHVDNIKAPLLVGQGANDPRVKVAESDQIVAAMRQKKLPVSYVVYTDEGHGFVRPENRLDFFGRAEVFLAKYLGGRVEPWKKYPGSSVQER